MTKKGIYGILAVFALLLAACQSPQDGQAIQDAEIAVTEESGNYVLRDGNGNLILYDYSYRYPNGNLEFRLTDSNKWVIFDSAGSVLYDGIDTMYSDYRAETLLEDGTTLYRYFGFNGDLMLEGVGEDYAGWHFTGLAGCYFRFEDGSTLVQNFAAGQEVRLPCKADFSTFITEMAEKTGRILFGDYENQRSYLVDEYLTVSELEGFFCFFQEGEEVCLMRSDRTLCALDGTPLPQPLDEMEAAASD